MANDAEQKSILVPQHKRMAQGEKLDGSSMGSKGSDGKKQGGLSHALKKKSK